MEDLLQYVGTCDDKPTDAAKAAFYFLYKEILVNRVLIYEQGEKPNRGGVEFNEKLINESREP